MKFDQPLYLERDPANQRLWVITATIDLRNAATVEQLKAIGTAPVQGTFQIPGASIVAPLQPSNSVLLYRMACSGRGRMPHIGSSEVDVAGVALIRDWIMSLQPSEKITHAPKASLVSTPAALELVARLDEGTLDGSERERLLQEARDAAPEIRNLFTRFQPLEYRQQQNRTLNPAELLLLNGNAAQGTVLFADKRLQCITCHKIGQEGGQTGPALDDIGRRLKRHEILEAILEPSVKIDPKFAAWTALTIDGKIHSGLMMSRSEQEIILRTAKNETVSVARNDLEELIRQTVSLMPDRLLNDLSDQQIADLLAFLSAQKADGSEVRNESDN